MKKINGVFFGSRKLLVSLLASLGLASSSYGYSLEELTYGSQDKVAASVSLVATVGVAALIAAVVSSSSKHHSEHDNEQKDPEKPDQAEISIDYSRTTPAAYLYPGSNVTGKAVITITNPTRHEVALTSASLMSGDPGLLEAKVTSNNCKAILVAGESCSYEVSLTVDSSYDFSRPVGIVPITFYFSYGSSKIDKLVVLHQLLVYLVGYDTLAPLPTGITGFNHLASPQVNKALPFKDRLYAATDFGLSVSFNGGETWQTYTTLDGLPSNKITSVGIADVGEGGRDRIVYVGTNQGLARCIDTGFNLVGCAVEPEVEVAVNDIFVSGDIKSGISVCVGTVNGLYVSWIDASGAGNWIRYTAADGSLASDNVQSIYMGAGAAYSKICACGTDKGLSLGHFVDNDGTISFFETRLNEKNISSVYVDDTAVIYAGSDEELFISRTYGDDSWEKPEELVGKSISSIYVDGTGVVYVGTTSGELWLSSDRGANFVKSAYDTGTAGNAIKSIQLDDSGKIYLGTSGAGVALGDKNDLGSLKTCTTDWLAAEKITSVHGVVSDKSLVYAGSAVNGVTSFSFENGQPSLGNNYKKATNGLVDNHVSSIFATKGWLYIGTASQGLSVAKIGDSGEVEQWEETYKKQILDDNPHHLVSNEVTSIACAEFEFTPEGGGESSSAYRLLVGTKNGFSVATGGSNDAPRFMEHHGGGPLDPVMVNDLGVSNLLIPGNNFVVVATDVGALIYRIKADAVVGNQLDRVGILGGLTQLITSVYVERLSGADHNVYLGVEKGGQLWVAPDFPMYNNYTSDEAYKTAIVTCQTNPITTPIENSSVNTITGEVNVGTGTIYFGTGSTENGGQLCQVNIGCVDQFEGEVLKIYHQQAVGDGASAIFAATASGLYWKPLRN